MNNVVLLDGAMGTCLWEKAQKKVPVWRYNLEEPAIVLELHREYLDAGSRILCSNTFGANAAAVSKSAFQVEDVVAAGVNLARQAADGKARVALDVGPLTGLLEPYGDIEADEAEALYAQQIGAGMAEGPDLIFLETFMDIEMLKIAARVANRYDVPLFCSMSFEKSGRTIMGNSVQDMLDGLAGLRVDAVGLNCSLGPDLALPVLEEFLRRTTLPVLFKPNAGMPELVDGEMQSSFDIDAFVQGILAGAEAGAAYVGGCCGSTPAYIRRLRERLERR